MPAPVAIETDGHRTMLKWHRGRKQPSDTPFTATRIREGLAAGASIEIDLQVTGDGNLAVLHDPLLEASTTGTGPVDRATSSEISACRFLDAKGNDSGEHVMLLSDLAALVADGPTRDGAVLQLDFKDPLDAFHDNTASLFAQAVRPVAKHMILSGGDARAVTSLAQAVSGLPVGYDPCLQGKMERTMASGDYPGFVADALSTAPWASMMYLHYALVLAADADGFDMIGAFHAAGKTVDAWTIRNIDETTRPAVIRLLQLKADQITTDDAEGLFALFA